MSSLSEQTFDFTRSPPTSEEFIKSLPYVNVTEKIGQSKTACSICLDFFSVGDTVRRLPCRHCYHQSCVIPWLSKNSTCPSCRQDLPTDDHLFNEERAFQRVSRRLDDEERADSYRRRGHCRKDDDFDAKEYSLNSMYM